ncbi:TRAPP trafficking subunit Trs65-domain-containing protein [Zychaea mexicana]|uniref:TRAPP trafficking subunit Trs65-domain-containing protein n=1 Tax=Zychaea mexicana TaxID=64656 RepID=UPI0022FDD4F1|nr:TRAPP trafficking subunit Trs65-domain-containing protein [Zychaea mexicana]KAI9499058.1 TRAPP trafficking subunit Trs65-domain-containing protein [Zychaea mexicana]
MDTSGISSELFFNEAEFRVLIPNVSTESEPSPQEILSTPSRRFTFYDEHLKVYLYARIPHQLAGTGDEVQQTINTFFNQLDVHLETSIVDSNPHPQPAAVPPPLQPSSSFSSSFHHRSITQKWNPSSSAPSSPKTHKRELSMGQRGPMSAGTPPQQPANESALPFFSHTYNSRGKDPEPIVFEHEEAYCCIYSLTVPILYVKTRSNNPLLSFAFNVSYRPMTTNNRSHKQDEDKTEEGTEDYDADMFETIDLLNGLSEDPVFSTAKLHQRFVIEKHSRQSSGSFSQSSHSTSQMLTLRRHVREMLSVRSGVNVKMRTTNASVADKMVMMSVELENPLETSCSFVVDKVEVQVSNAVVSVAFSNDVKFPITLETLDQMVFLYNVTLLEDGSAKPPQQMPRMFPARNRNTPAMPVHYQDERLQPQRVSIQVFGAPLIDGVRAAPMRSKWNTMLDVMGMRQKREEPDPRFSSLLASSTNSFIASRSSAASLSTSVSVSPGARSVGSPLGQVMDGRKRMIMATSNIAESGPQTPVGQRAPPVPGVPARKSESEVVDGIVVSFTVPASITVGKIFPLQIFIVNRSKHTRRFMVTIPNRKRQQHTAEHMVKTTLPPLPIEQNPIDPYMDEAEFLRQYFDNETHEADIICLENNVRLSPLGPSTSQAVDVRFIAVKERLHTIDLIQLVDQDTGFVTNLRHVLEIFVDKRTDDV